MGLAFLLIVLLDVAFLAVCVLAIAPLVMYKRAAFAVLKRNFIGYFSNPTGYVFLCLFVLLTSFAAFWPHEFFTANLANLNQLNNVLPFIMMVFIPAITMSIWSEERRQGTDELLLTLPADDFDIRCSVPTIWPTVSFCPRRKSLPSSRKRSIGMSCCCSVQR